MSLNYNAFNGSEQDHSKCLIFLQIFYSELVLFIVLEGSASPKSLLHVMLTYPAEYISIHFHFNLIPKFPSFKSLMMFLMQFKI